MWYGSGDRRRLPQWARRLVEVGVAVASHAVTPEQRLVAALAVPARAYAAVLGAIGVVVGRDPMSFSNDATTPEALAAHFDRLCELPRGTTVTVLTSGGSMKVGTVRGVEERAGVVEVIVDQKDFVHRIREEFAHRVALRGLGLRCLLVGQLSVLEKEITGDDVVTGSRQPLQAILKARRFAGKTDKDIRTDLVSPHADLPRELRDAQPAVVVFDGTESFRRWKEEWRSAAWIIVLDRSSRYFDEGVTLVEEENALRRGSDDEPLGDLEPPPGTELMAFWGRA
jgi:hypothetical protein